MEAATARLSAELLASAELLPGPSSPLGSFLVEEKGEEVRGFRCHRISEEEAKESRGTRTVGREERRWVEPRKRVGVGGGDS